MRPTLVLSFAVAILAACEQSTSPLPAPTAPAPVQSLLVTSGEPVACVEDSLLPERMAVRLGFASLSRSDGAIEAVVDCVSSLWPGSSDRTGYLSSTLWALLRVGPEATVTAMSRHPQMMDEWLGSSFEKRVFEGGFDGSSCRFTGEIVDTRQRLLNLKLEGASAAVRQKLAERLARTTCSDG